MNRLHCPPRWTAALVCVMALLGVAAVLAQSLPASGATARDPAVTLTTRYADVAGALAHSPFGLPLVVSSRDEGSLAEGEILGIVPHPFATLAAAFASPQAFCDVAVLHPNVKGCTRARVDGEERVTLYAGRKHYEPATRVYAQDYVALVPRVEAGYLRVVLQASAGPLDTHDYTFTLEAIPAGDATFIAVRYAYRSSLASRAVATGYLATVGAGKTGFSLSEAGGPARGVRGIVERNAMRHYLALLAVLDTATVSEDARTSARLDRYYTLTDRFAAQLREFDRHEYVAIKTRELAEQRDRDRHNSGS
ncbi:MAG: hypothetical protein ABI777_10725 [Betaproteobacteria bacterium]